MSAPPDDEHRQRGIALLEANHAFPCAFSLSVIARNDEAVTRAVLAAAGLPEAPPEGAHEPRPSSGGKYLSHRILVPCATANEVLDLFARVRAVDGVITVL